MLMSATLMWEERTDLSALRGERSSMRRPAGCGLPHTLVPTESERPCMHNAGDNRRQYVASERGSEAGEQWEGTGNTRSRGDMLHQGML
jgi:hypothetical protein